MSSLLVITGGSRGIGAATLARFAESDWQLVNVSRQKSTQAGAKNIAINLQDDASLSAAMPELQSLAEQADRVCLIHNAAMYPSDRVDNFSLETFDDTLNLNLRAPLQLTHALLPQMGDGSSILYVGSTLAMKAVPGNMSYIVSKHALVGLMRATCQDLAGRAIHTACINPGITDTQMVRDVVGDNAELMSQLKAKVGADRLVQPEEIANCLYFCAMNPVINGACIEANLGQIES